MGFYDDYKKRVEEKANDPYGMHKLSEPLKKAIEKSKAVPKSNGSSSGGGSRSGSSGGGKSSGSGTRSSTTTSTLSITPTEEVTPAWGPGGRFLSAGAWDKAMQAYNSYSPAVQAAAAEAEKNQAQAPTQPPVPKKEEKPQNTSGISAGGTPPVPKKVEKAQNTAVPATPTIEAAAQDAASNQVTPEGVAIRQSMIDRGFNNDLIGWDGQNVTYGGQAVFKPSQVIDGVSYVDKEMLDKNLNALSSTFVNAADYAASKGITGGAQWYNDGTVTVLGKSIPVKQIKTDGGNSYAMVDQKDIDNVYNQFQAENPTLFKAYNDYEAAQAKADKLWDRIENRKEFEYDVESDPAYKAYYDAAMRAAEYSYNDIKGKLLAMTGGFANSNAMFASKQAHDAHLQTLNEQIPILQQAAYDRWRNERQMDMDTYNAWENAQSNRYQNKLQAAMYLSQLINQANEFNYNRHKDARNEEWLEKEAAREQANFDKEYIVQKALAEADIAQGDKALDLEGRKLNIEERQNGVAGMNGQNVYAMDWSDEQRAKLAKLDRIAVLMSQYGMSKEEAEEFDAENNNYKRGMYGMYGYGGY